MFLEYLMIGFFKKTFVLEGFIAGSVEGLQLVHTILVMQSTIVM